MAVTEEGVEGDRAVAVIDVATGMVASAKHPKLWRGLLQFNAWWNNGTTQIQLPDGRTRSSSAPTPGITSTGTHVARKYRKSHTPPQQSCVFGGGTDRSASTVDASIGRGL
ncbi:hypothetical protein Airi02_013510 [Actinoallomurus iriomotensis]|uniref:Uncharacterized protein n=1 Tax=Actinoallomurus iriomotensis TaxID=478107 RepID=A0A9W6VZ20_9ACTN|nr:hypothetical protein Airi02_013510 [Actinoallomurus iriomotensis]